MNWLSHYSGHISNKEQIISRHLNCVFSKSLASCDNIFESTEHQVQNQTLCKILQFNLIALHQIHLSGIDDTVLYDFLKTSILIKNMYCLCPVWTMNCLIQQLTAARPRPRKCTLVLDQRFVSPALLCSSSSAIAHITCLHVTLPSFKSDFCSCNSYLYTSIQCK